MTLNRAPVNALNLEMLGDITKATKYIEEDQKMKGMILTSSTPRVFSAGLDLPQLMKMNRKEMEVWWDTFTSALISLCGTRLHSVAAVNGSSPAGGTVLASNLFNFHLFFFLFLFYFIFILFLFLFLFLFFFFFFFLFLFFFFFFFFIFYFYFYFYFLFFITFWLFKQLN